MRLDCLVKIFTGGPCTHQHGDGDGGGTGGSGSGRSAENGKKSHRLTGTPLKAPAYPTVSFPPSIMLKVRLGIFLCFLFRLENAVYDGVYIEGEREISPGRP